MRHVAGMNGMTHALKVGVKFAGDMPISEMLDSAALAEKTGYSSLWVNESRFTRDAVTRISAIAAVTKTAAVGTAVLNPFTRSVMLLAITAATIDEISKGRFILGMGIGTKRYLSSEGIHVSKSLTRLREYVLVMRRLWRGETVSFQGETIGLSQVKLDFRPFRDNVPIYFGATEKRGIEFAASVGDGIILNGYTPKSHAEGVRELLAQGESNSNMPVLGNVMVSMDEDEEAAIEGARPLAFTYFTSIPAIAKANGISQDLIHELRELESKEGLTNAMEQLPVSIIRNAVAAGTAEQCKKWIRDYLQAGLHEVLITRIHGSTRRIVEEISERFID